MVLLSAAVKGVPVDTWRRPASTAPRAADLLPGRGPADQGHDHHGLHHRDIGVMKIFDIVYVMTNGNFNTNVLGNEFWNQLSTNFNNGAPRRSS
jgi:alpha-glucoside transport system permease protein